MITFLLALDWATLHPWRETRNWNKCSGLLTMTMIEPKLINTLKECCYQLRYQLVVTMKSISCVIFQVCWLEGGEGDVEGPGGDTSRNAYVELLKCSFMFHARLHQHGGSQTQVFAVEKWKKKHNILWRNWGEGDKSLFEIFSLWMTILIIYSGWIKYQNDLCQSKTVWRNVLLTDNVSVSLDIILSK